MAGRFNEKGGDKDVRFGAIGFIMFLSFGSILQFVPMVPLCRIDPPASNRLLMIFFSHTASDSISAFFYNSNIVHWVVFWGQLINAGTFDVDRFSITLLS